MSYQVLARKYRPRSFRELVGQEHVARALTNALDQDRLHHAYLFTGTRGVGKTTIARILAKCLNCETGISSEPCGVCTTCQEINEGRFIDLIEIDAASNNGVDDVREIIDNAQYAPTRGRYKVYLIDEVHMLSKSAFNALLKTLEEPPAHVKFLLATTDPQKLPITVLSRCLQFALKIMSPERVVSHLENVLQKEVVPFEEGALWELGRAANGSMRDALSLTDQAIAFGNGRLDTADVRAMLGSIDRDHVFRVLDAVNSGDASVVLAVSAQLAEQSVDYLGALKELISALHHVALAQMLPSAADNTMGDRDRILAVAAASTAEDIQLYYQIAVQGRRDMPYAADLRSGFEMTLLRMLAFRPVPARKPSGQSASRPVAPRPATQPAMPPTQPSGGGVGTRASLSAAVQQTAAVATAAATQPYHLPTAQPSAQAAPQNKGNIVDLPVRKAVPPIPDAPPPQTLVASPAIQEPPLPVQPEALCTVQYWEQWVRTSGLTGGGLNLARHAALRAADSHQFELQVSARHELVASQSSFSLVEAAFRQHYPEAHLRLVLTEPSYKIPMQVIAERKQARQKEAEQSLRDDPNVQMMMRDFQAEFLPDSIIPLN